MNTKSSENRQKGKTIDSIMDHIPQGTYNVIGYKNNHKQTNT